jgi:pyruvate kinase
MKLRSLTLSSLALLPAATDAFLGPSFGAAATPKTTTTGGTTTSTTSTSTTTTVVVLRARGGMDDYDAHMRAIFSASTTTAAVAADPPTVVSGTDNFKSSPRWRKKTKQLATLGPASSTFEMIEKLFLAGADVFRLNFSHGEHAQKRELLDIIRSVESKYDHPIAILGDLQGPKLRVGKFANADGEVLRAGQMFRFDLSDEPGTARRVKLPHPEIIEASEVGHVLLIDDGKVKLQVAATGPGYLDCVVVVPGKIKDKKVRRMTTSCRDVTFFMPPACVREYVCVMLCY